MECVRRRYHTIISTEYDRSVQQTVRHRPRRPCCSVKTRWTRPRFHFNHAAANITEIILIVIIHSSNISSSQTRNHLCRPSSAVSTPGHRHRRRGLPPAPITGRPSVSSTGRWSASRKWWSQTSCAPGSKITRRRSRSSGISSRQSSIDFCSSCSLRPRSASLSQSCSVRLTLATSCSAPVQTTSPRRRRPPRPARRVAAVWARRWSRQPLVSLTARRSCRDCCVVVQAVPRVTSFLH